MRGHVWSDPRRCQKDRSVRVVFGGLFEVERSFFRIFGQQSAVP